MSVIGNKILNLRLSQNPKITQQQLAEKAEVHVTLISKLEQGKTAGSLGTLAKIAAALGVPLAELLMDEDPPNPAA